MWASISRNKTISNGKSERRGELKDLQVSFSLVDPIRKLNAKRKQTQVDIHLVFKPIIVIVEWVLSVGLSSITVLRLVIIFYIILRTLIFK